MIESFYTALVSAETWFFGSILQDQFVSFVVNAFNSFLVVGLFFSVIYYPIHIMIQKFVGYLRRE